MTGNTTRQAGLAGKCAESHAATGHWFCQIRLAKALGFWELLNPAYGMGRQTAAYRGHLMTFHGGDLPGFHSQVSFMPNDKIGVIVLVISDHSAPLYNVISYKRVTNGFSTWTKRPGASAGCNSGSPGRKQARKRARKPGAIAFQTPSHLTPWRLCR